MPVGGQVGIQVHLTEKNLSGFLVHVLLNCINRLEL